MRFKIELDNVGRGKVTYSFEIETESLLDAEDAAATECRKYLASRFIDTCHDYGPFYTVYAGDRPVGKVSITKL